MSIGIGVVTWLVLSVTVVAFTIIALRINHHLEAGKVIEAAIEKVTVLGGLGKLLFIEANASSDSFEQSLYMSGYVANEAVRAFEGVLSSERIDEAFVDGMNTVSYYVSAEGHNDDNAQKFLNDIDIVRKELGL